MKRLVFNLGGIPSSRMKSMKRRKSGKNVVSSITEATFALIVLQGISSTEIVCSLKEKTAELLILSKLFDLFSARQICEIVTFVFQVVTTNV